MKPLHQEYYNFEQYKPIINHYITQVRPAFLANNVKNFISNQYAELYNAEISIDYPYLAYIEEKNNVCCAAGFRFAKNEYLFLEQYINQPIEQTIHCTRDEIVEVGNLAISNYSLLFKLLYDLNIFLMDNNVNYIAITATEKLAKVLKKRGITGEFLANAESSKLKRQSNNWGSYYNTNPKVYIFNLNDNINQIKKIIKASNKESAI